MKITKKALTLKKWAKIMKEYQKYFHRISLDITDDTVSIYIYYKKKKINE